MAPAQSNTAKVSWCISTRASSSWPSVTRVSGIRGGSRAPAGHPAGWPDDPLVHADVVACHAGGGEAVLELFPAAQTIELEYARQRSHRLVHRVHDRPGDPRSEELLDRAATEGEDRGPTGHRLDH